MLTVDFIIETRKLERRVRLMRRFESPSTRVVDEGGFHVAGTERSEVLRGASITWWTLPFLGLPEVDGEACVMLAWV